MIKFRFQNAHTRPIDCDDRYFIVKVEFLFGTMEIGWIEKEWNKEQFEKISGKKVISFEEFSKEEYEKIKQNV